MICSLQSASNGVPMLIVGRVVAGLSVGIGSTIVPVYQAEIAPKEIRGRVVSLQQCKRISAVADEYQLSQCAQGLSRGVF